MDFELAISIICITLLPVAGIIGIIICSRILNKISNAEKCPAIIVGYEDNREDGEQFFICNVKISDDKIIKCRRLLRVKFFEKSSKYIGKELMIPYDRKDDKILPDERIVRTYLYISIAIFIFGFSVSSLCVFFTSF